MKQKTPPPRELTFAGMDTELRRQSANATIPMDSTFFPMVSEARDLLAVNAPKPIEMTESGMVIDLRPL